MPRASVNGISLNYQTMGDGPDVILIHGATGNMAFWYLNILPKLLQGFRVTVYDLRGHGYSDAPPRGYTSSDMAEDLHGLMDRLVIDRAHLVGYSYGGVIALHMASLYSDRVSSLVLTDSEIPALRHLFNHKEWPHWKAWKEWLSRFGIDIPDEKSDDLDFIARAFAGIASRPESAANFVKTLKDLNVHVPVGYEHVKAQRRMSARLLRLLNETTLLNDIRVIGGLTAEKLTQLGHPILAIYGELSPYYNSCCFLKENMINCRVVKVPRGHFFPALEPDLFIDHISVFLQDPMGYIRSSSQRPTE